RSGDAVTELLKAESCCPRSPVLGPSAREQYFLLISYTYTKSGALGTFPGSSDIESHFQHATYREQHHASEPPLPPRHPPPLRHAHLSLPPGHRQDHSALCSR